MTMTKQQIIEQVEEFVYGTLKNTITEYYEKNLENLPVPQIRINYGSSYAKIIVGSSAWGFIALKEGKSDRHTQGDLLRAATWNSPSPISRGSILDGTAKFDTYGPNYCYEL